MSLLLSVGKLRVVYAECCLFDCHAGGIIMLCVIMLSVIIVTDIVLTVVASLKHNADGLIS